MALHMINDREENDWNRNFKSYESQDNEHKIIMLKYQSFYFYFTKKEILFLKKLSLKNYTKVFIINTLWYNNKTKLYKVKINTNANNLCTFIENLGKERMRFFSDL